MADVDYIIVGGGSTGSVHAGRLTGLSQTLVLDRFVLEDRRSKGLAHLVTRDKLTVASSYADFCREVSCLRKLKRSDRVLSSSTA